LIIRIIYDSGLSMLQTLGISPIIRYVHSEIE
jgi:hypothetical protein